MPIKPENAKRYPADWADIRARILRRAGNRCEFCQVDNYKLGGRSIAGRFHPALPTGTDGMRNTWPKEGEFALCEGFDIKLRIIRIVLTVAHLDHVPENCDPANLKALCQRCHLKYDNRHHRANAAETRRKKAGTLELFPEENNQ